MYSPPSRSCIPRPAGEPPRLDLTALVAVLLVIGCGSAESSARDAAMPPAAGTGGSPSSAMAGGSSTSTPVGSSPEISAPAKLSAGTGASSGAGTGPVSRQEPPVEDACSSPSADGCAACLCEKCKGVLDACASTSGCPEILVCVRENACSGSDCYCGDASLPACFSGRGNGPCREAVLTAPSGQEPTLANPSGGPASDAALGVAACAQKDARCTAACGFAG
jgi:hypothetical protein